mmetsp:Transcript_18674/g.16540  ORF Transcript_18674/g.16540 Transcript_18674/m.16540 type:complete len:109 (+) Transcript_18674:23-349(+)
MIATNANVVNSNGDTNRGPAGSRRQTHLGKKAANAFISAGRNKNEEDNDDGGNILDQRRINEIFVRLKVAEISSLNFAFLGILCGIFDYEIAYNDGKDEEKTTRIILE